MCAGVSEWQEAESVFSTGSLKSRSVGLVQKLWQTLGSWTFPENEPHVSTPGIFGLLCRCLSPDVLHTCWCVCVCVCVDQNSSLTFWFTLSNQVFPVWMETFRACWASAPKRNNVRKRLRKQLSFRLLESPGPWIRTRTAAPSWRSSAKRSVRASNTSELCLDYVWFFF